MSKKTKMNGPFSSFKKSEKGSVSIFLIIIFALIFFFNAVLIDYARIITADKRLESAVRAATRSVLSTYDMELNQLFALYGLNETTYEEIFQYVLEKNLEQSTGYFNFTDTKLEKEAQDLSFNHFLADHRVLEEQILQEMKYKAPVNIAIELLDKFNQLTQLADTLEEAAETTNVLGDVSELYEKRNQLLLVTEQHIINVRQILGEASNLSSLEIIADGYSNYAGNINSLDTFTNMLQDSSLTNEEMQAIGQEKKELEKEIKDYQAASQELVNKVYSGYSNSKISDNIKEAIENIEKARRINQEIETAINQHKSSTRNEDLGGILKDDLIIAESFFSERKADIELLSESYNDLLAELGEFKSFVIGTVTSVGLQSNEEITFTSSQFRTTINRLTNLNQKLVSNINNAKEDYEEIKKQITTNQIEQEQPEQTASYQQFKKLLNLIEQAKGNNAQFKELEQYYSSYVTYNRQQQANDYLGYDITGIAQTDKISKLFSDIATALTQFRDDVYINEYVFERFNYFQPKSLADFITIKDQENNNGKINEGPAIEAKSEQIINLLAIDKQEVEYIIYGKHLPGANIASAFRDIFFIRLGINTLEGFSDPYVRSLVHPLAILGGAILYGLTESLVDLIKLIQKDAIELSKYTKGINLTYKDHLRLISMLHSNDLSKLSRIQALISLKTKKDLANVPTYVHGRATASIKLIFLPAVMKGLNLAGVLPGNVQAGRYYITKEIVFTY